MSKFNFDLLFDGSIEQQSLNVHAFMHGVTTAQRDVRRNLAMSVLRGDGGLQYIDQLKEFDQMIKAFSEDTRTKSLTAEVERMNAEHTLEAREKLGRQIAAALAKVL